ncbi:MAG: hypothetical protein ACK5TR_05290 [Alphaproteobacteria bacterium]|jgi:hypothetical protein
MKKGLIALSISFALGVAPSITANVSQTLNEELPHPDFMVQDLYARSQNTLGKLSTVLESIKSRLPCTEVHIPPLKGAARAKEKVKADYGGDWSRLTDVVRASISFDTLDTLKKGVDYFKESGLKIVLVKDRFSNPLAVGYRDILMLFEDPENGVIGEIQFHLCHIIKIKDDEHKAYEVVRSLQAEAATNGRSLTQEEQEMISDIETKSKFVYSKAFFSAVSGEGCHCPTRP